MVGEKWREKRMGPSKMYCRRSALLSVDGVDSICLKGDQ